MIMNCKDCYVSYDLQPSLLSEPARERTFHPNSSAVATEVPGTQLHKTTLIMQTILFGEKGIFILYSVAIECGLGASHVQIQYYS